MNEIVEKGETIMNKATLDKLPKEKLIDLVADLYAKIIIEKSGYVI